MNQYSEKDIRKNNLMNNITLLSPDLGYFFLRELKYKDLSQRTVQAKDQTQLGTQRWILITFGYLAIDLTLVLY